MNHNSEANDTDYNADEYEDVFNEEESEFDWKGRPREDA